MTHEGQGKPVRIVASHQPNPAALSDLSAVSERTEVLQPFLDAIKLRA